MVILLCGCTTQEERTCEKCETFFSENNHYPYPKRMGIFNTREMITGTITNGAIKQDSISNRNLIFEGRLLTPKEYGDLKSIMFCFIGEDYDYVLSFFKDFVIYPKIYGNDLPDLRIDYLDVLVCSRRHGSENNYRCDDDCYQKTELWHSKIDDKYIFLGSKSDSLNLQNCLQN